MSSGLQTCIALACFSNFGAWANTLRSAEGSPPPAHFATCIASSIPASLVAGRGDQLAAFGPAIGTSNTFLPIRTFALQSGAPHALSANRRVVVGLASNSTKDRPDIVAVNVASGEQIGRVPLAGSDPPDRLWVNDLGTVVGALIRDRFIVWSVAGPDPTSAPLFEGPSNLVVASPSGRFVLLVDAAGRLSVVGTRDWKELPAAQKAIESGLGSWLMARSPRRSRSATEGPFVYPVVPVEVSPDDRLLAVFLGENANTYVNVCMSTGTVASVVQLDKRVNAKAAFSSSGQLFGVQVVPNSDDPAFKRPVADFGYRVYDAWSGSLLQTVPLSTSDLSGFSRAGAAFFMNDWSGWRGFAAGDKAVFRFDARTGQVAVQPLKPVRVDPPAVLTGERNCQPVAVD